MKRFLIFAVLFITTDCVTAQLHRFGSWNSVNTDFNLNKKWSLGADETVRFYPLSPYEIQWLTDVAVNYELSKHWDVGAGYRYVIAETQNSGRPMFNIAYSTKVKKFQISDRVKYQFEFDKNNNLKQYVRNKLTLKYRKPKKFTPHVGGELFYLLGYGNYFVDSYRLYAGTEYKINKRLGVDVEWMHEQEIQVKNPLTTDVLQLGLNYSFSPTRSKHVGDVSSLNR